MHSYLNSGILLNNSGLQGNLRMQELDNYIINIIGIERASELYSINMT